MKYLLAIFFIAFLFACSHTEIPEKGVSLDLAQKRKESIDSIHYKLGFDIPADKAINIEGSLELRFYLKKKNDQIILDFKEESDHVLSIKQGDKNLDWTFTNEHIILENKNFNPGWNSVQISFIAGDLSLNRQDEIMYTLFVPDRARTAFPCFDQPDLKANYTLSLSIPEKWTACANGKEISNKTLDGKRFIEFGSTKALPTYLFSFVVGEFDIIKKSQNGFDVRLFHRETDQKLLDANIDEIFRQVFSSIEWMEDYSDIPYPFAKYDLIAIPSFQYGGMEHTGATLYRANRIILPESPTENQLLARANLIAHETAHMWFGDLVTMKWFNEVWLKEVFANFIAEKITNPWFPEIDHDLKFLMAHYPASYEIDRSTGANPIQQKLDNLENAGTVYGAIIYHKAPIVMRKLEEITGQEAMKKGLREYLKDFSYSNAGWNDLIDILDELNEEDLRTWSKIWIEEPGMPVYTTYKDEYYYLKQSDPNEKSRLWPDKMIYLYEENSASVFFKESVNPVKIHFSESNFLNSDGFCYGFFNLGKDGSELCLENLIASYSNLSNTTKISQWMILYENLLNDHLSAKSYIKNINTAISQEDNNLILQYIINVQSICFWNFLNEEDRELIYNETLNTLWSEFERRTGSSKKMLFSQIVNLEAKKSGLERIRQIWKKGSYGDMQLSEFDQLEICYELCLKLPEDFNEISDFQKERTMNKDRLDQLIFILPSLNPEYEIRENFFSSLLNKENREIESNVITAIHYLNHPLRRDEEIKHLYTSLEILPEIQMTGDIFFPKRWLDGFFSNHNSPEAYREVERFLTDNPDLAEHLKLKILQSTDMLSRTASILENTD